MRVESAGSVKGGQSEARVKTGTSFLKYNVFKSAENSIAGPVLRLLGKDY